jgi:hypothetical protein
MFRSAFFIAISVVGFGSIYNGGDCGCRAVDSSVTTRSGGNEFVVLKQSAALKSLKGKVTMPLPELNEDVLVEVFDQPDYLICEWRDGNPNNCTSTPPETQHRIAACVTRKDGRFCFSNLPAGKYELRVSKGPSWSPTHFHVPVAPNGTTKPLEVPVHIGT